MADAIIRCGRCGHTQPAPPPLSHGLRRTAVCERCLALIVTRDLGELSGPDDRAEPTDWGSLGWT